MGITTSNVINDQHKLYLLYDKFESIFKIYINITPLNINFNPNYDYELKNIADLLNCILYYEHEDNFSLSLVFNKYKQILKCKRKISSYGYSVRIDERMHFEYSIHKNNDLKFSIIRNDGESRRKYLHLLTNEHFIHLTSLILNIIFFENERIDKFEFKARSFEKLFSNLNNIKIPLKILEIINNCLREKINSSSLIITQNSIKDLNHQITTKIGIINKPKDDIIDKKTKSNKLLNSIKNKNLNNDERKKIISNYEKNIGEIDKNKHEIKQLNNLTKDITTKIENYKFYLITFKNNQKIAKLFDYSYYKSSN